MAAAARCWRVPWSAVAFGHADPHRQQFYDRVWTTPVETLAAELGLSGRGLAKLCARYDRDWRSSPAIDTVLP